MAWFLIHYQCYFKKICFMFYNVITLNPNQANDFIKKYMQDNIKVIDFSKDDENGIYFVTLRTGKWLKKKITSWQFRPGIGLCFGEHVVEGTNKGFDFYQFDSSLIAKANDIVWKYICDWEKISPV